MGQGSKRSALCQHPGPPPLKLDCRGDAVLYGTSGWNLGPFYSEEEELKQDNLSRLEHQG